MLKLDFTQNDIDELNYTLPRQNLVVFNDLESECHE